MPDFRGTNPGVKKLAWFLIALAVIAGLLAVYISRRGGEQIGTSSGPPLLSEQRSPTVEDYRQTIRAAFKDFLEQRAQLTEELNEARAAAELPTIRSVKEKIFQIIVPGSERDSHLSLVLSLSWIEQGIIDKDEALWEKGEQALGQYLKDNEIRI